ncbi:hypothetical protein AB0H86_32500 [Streptomyces sp. NPDC050997]|uniref:SCO2400 family protein n=1 Tax=Streptomyces sp. NPDC050997 TaxID=3155519 RepID=UPI003436643E
MCPGCGAYAPDIAPPFLHGRDGLAPGAWAMTGDAAGTAHAAESAASDRWHDETVRDEAELGTGANTAPHTDPSADVDGVPPEGQGRAARRRQRARWKKNQRRAVVATAVALVGGGLTITTMNRGSTDQAQAATAPDNRSMGAAEEQAPERSRPASAPPTIHRSSPTTPEAEPPVTNDPREQSLSTPSRTTRSVDRPDAGSPRPAASSTPQSQSTTPPLDTTTPETTTPETTDPATEQPSKTAPTNGNGNSSDHSQTQPAPASTSPTQLCLLVVCLG